MAMTICQETRGQLGSYIATYAPIQSENTTATVIAYLKRKVI